MTELPDDFTWFFSAAAGRKITSGMVSSLDFGDGADEGVYFVSETDHNRIAKADVVHYRAGKRVVFTVPALEPGRYTLAVNRAAGHEIRKGHLKAVVTVN